MWGLNLTNSRSRFTNWASQAPPTFPFCVGICHKHRLVILFILRDLPAECALPAALLRGPCPTPQDTYYHHSWESEL